MDYCVSVCMDAKTPRPYCYSAAGVSIYGNPCNGFFKLKEWSKKSKRFVIREYRCDIVNQCGYSLINERRRSLKVAM